MFNVSFTEILVIVIVIFIVVDIRLLPSFLKNLAVFIKSIQDYLLSVKTELKQEIETLIEEEDFEIQEHKRDKK